MSVRKLTSTHPLAVPRALPIPQQHNIRRGQQEAIRATSTSGRSSIMTFPAPTVRPGEETARGLWNPTRSIRLLLLMGGVWALHMFDLQFTLQEASKGSFVELNPVAALVLNTSYTGVVLYKFILLGGATAILWWLREHAITERAGWLLLITAVMLFIRWQMYFDLAPEKPLSYMQPLAVGT